MTMARPSVTSRMFESAVARRVDHAALERVAEREEEGREEGNGKIGVEPERGMRDPDGEHRPREERAMGEVDDVQHAVDEGEAERDERVDGAGEEAVHEGLGDDRGGVHQQLLRHPRARAARPEDLVGVRALHRHGVLGSPRFALRPRMTAYPLTGNTGFASANASGKITLMSLPCTCVLTGPAPWFWPLTNFVSP
jgi:hypothetical protein